MALMTRTKPRVCWVSCSLLFLAGSIHIACQALPVPVAQNDLKTARLEKFAQLSFDGWISALAFTEGGRTLTVGGCQAILAEARGGRRCSQGMVKVWSLEDVHLKTTATYPKEVTALAISPDGKQWVAGDSEGRLIRSKVATRVIPRPLNQHGEITALTVSPDGRWAASGSLDPSYPLGFMDMRTGGVVRVTARLAPVSSLAFSPDGKYLAVGMSKGGIVVWNFTSQGDLIRVAPNVNEKQTITSVIFSPDGQLLAYGRQDGKIIVWDRTSERPLAEFSGSSSVSGLAFSPDGQYLAVGEDNGKVLLLESKGASQVWSKRHVLPVTDLAYSQDGSFLAVAVQQHVYLYYLEGSIEPSQLHRAQDWSPNRGRALAGIPPVGASRAFARVLELSQQEFLRLLPFDRLVANAVMAMAASIPGASFEPADVLQKTRAHMLVVRVNQRTVSVDLARLRRAEGRAGIQESVQAFESVRQFLLEADPRASVRLEDIAVKAVVTELGPSVRLVQMSGESILAPAGEDAQVVKEQTARLLEEGPVPYLKVSQFSASTAQQVKAWLQSEALPNRYPGAPILDLRDNPGDELDSVEQTASLLLPKGQLVASLVLRKTGDLVEYRSRGSVRSQGPFVVLVNERTAGTAEMLACAMQAAGTGVLVGTRTAGVNEVYRTFALPGGVGLRVSSARFDCPDGQDLRWKGRNVDLSVDRLPSAGVVSLGVASSRFQPGPHRPVHASVDLPGLTDRSLILGVHVALCLGTDRSESSATQRDQTTVRLKRHLTSCGLSPS